MDAKNYDIYAMLNKAKAHPRNFETRETFAPVKGQGPDLNAILKNELAPRVSLYNRVKASLLRKMSFLKSFVA